MKCDKGHEMIPDPIVEGAWYCEICGYSDYPWDDEPKQSVFDFIRGLFDIKRHKTS